MEQIRARVDAIVHDPATAEALKPYYRQFCKRPCFHDEYLDTFNRPNVTLVDTQGKGVERITAEGRRRDGRRVRARLPDLRHRLRGRHRLRAPRRLRAGTAATASPSPRSGRTACATLHGMHSRGFPNCFIMSNTQSGFTVNYPHMLNEQSEAHRVHRPPRARPRRRARSRSRRRPKRSGSRPSSASRARAGLPRELHARLLQQRGQAGRAQRPERTYGGGPIAFVKLLEDWRAEGSLKGLELR